ncbi:MAG: DivIVA domain-containing protein [Thermoleophilia bacterium]|nr:DivIVA domain-containing protein [Thermoleophilia bacterium]
MTLTPVELRHSPLPRKRLGGGYRRGAVDRLLAELADNYEDVWRERADLFDRVEHLEAELTRHRELESLLRTTLVSAERSAHELRDQAKREAQLVMEEAHAEARATVREALAERERLLGECRRVRALLRAALDTLEEPGPRALAEGRAEAEAA